MSIKSPYRPSPFLLAFLFALVPALCFPVLLPSLRLHFFAPFLIILIYKKNRTFCLWTAFICGTIFDLFGSYQHLGLWAFNYCLTIWILYPQKRNFFEDRLSTLPIMTLLFSFLSTFFQILLLETFESHLSLSFTWVLSELLFMPLMDALYAFLLFTLPSFFLFKPNKHEYFLK